MNQRRKLVAGILSALWLGLFTAGCAPGNPDDGSAEKAGPAAASQADFPVPYKTENWPQFRGPHATGITGNQDLPLNWDVAKGTNILWKTPIPGLGHSSPVVWGGRVFVTTAVGEGPEPTLKVGRYGESPENPEKFIHHFRVYCLDRESGEILWARTAISAVPQVARHVKSSHANSSPATDGKRVVVFFGSEGLYAYDMDGNLLWKKDLGYLDAGAFDLPEVQWGFGSSPVIHKDKVIVLCDVNNQSFIAAYSVDTGKEIWRTLRDENPTWGTPTVHESPARSQVIVNGFKHIGGYDLETGKALWWLRGGGDVPCPTPVVSHGLAFITNSHGRMRPIYAVRLGAAGDISLAAGETANEFIAWSHPRKGSYQPTPLAYGGEVYVNDNSGVLACFRAETGEELYRVPVGGDLSSYSASPVAADGRIYLTDEYGNIHIVKAGPDYEHLAMNPMGEICMATPAISGRTLFIRTRTRLFAVKNLAK